MPENDEHTEQGAPERQPVATDVFCGAGALTHGFVRAGIPVVAGFDVDETCRYAYEHNNAPARFVRRDVTELGADELMAYYPEDAVRILTGCAPCRPFSTYTRVKTGHADYDLLREFARLVAEGLPDVVSMENVRQLRKDPIYEEFLGVLEEHEYAVWADDVYCPSYGIPQRRTRLVLLASRFGPIELLPPTHEADDHPTVEDAIAHLPQLAAGEVCEADPLHRAKGLREINLRRIRATPEGGGWEDWPDELILDCHRRETGRTYGSVYGRMRWDGPAPTMTTQCCGLGNGRFGHPEQDRAISLREAALFQTFPEEYEFFPGNDFLGYATLERHIGNAVPVELGRVIAQSILAHLEIHRDEVERQRTRQPKRRRRR